MGRCTEGTAGSTRRDFLRDAALGLRAVAAADLPAREGRLRADDAPSTPGGRHHEAKALRVVHIFLGGGLSHVDSFDYKPELAKYHDTDMPASFGPADGFSGKAGRLHRSHYPFRRRGQSGLWVSDLFPKLAGVVDMLTVVNSMVAETADHIPGIFQANTGFRQTGYPAMGSWLLYGLGTENEDLPGYITINPRPTSAGRPTTAARSCRPTSGGRGSATPARCPTCGRRPRPAPSVGRST